VPKRQAEKGDSAAPRNISYLNFLRDTWNTGIPKLFKRVVKKALGQFDDQNATPQNANEDL